MSTIGLCQTTDRFKRYEDMVGHIVKFYIPDVKTSGYYSTQVSSPFVSVRGDITLLYVVDGFVTVDGVMTTEQGEVILSVRSKGRTGKIIVEKGYDLLKNSRSVSEWQDIMFLNVTKYNYISANSSLLKDISVFAPDYLKIEWELDPIMPARLDGKVLYRFALPELNRTCTVAAQDFMFFEKDFAESFQGEESAENLSDTSGLRKHQYDIMDNHRVYPAKIYYEDLSTQLVDSLTASYSFSASDNYEGLCYLPFSPYKIEGDLCYGIVGGEDVVANLKKVQFESVDDRSYLTLRASEGSDLRKHAASAYNSVMLENTLSDVEIMYLRYDSLMRQTRKYYADNQIVLLDSDVRITSGYFSNSNYADFSCNIYNPFDKRIKYIYITLKAINCVDDVCDRDTLRAVGFIDIGATAELSWESIFGNQNLDAIVEVQVSSIQLIFDDDSLVYFTSDDETFEKHFLSNHHGVADIRYVSYD